MKTKIAAFLGCSVLAAAAGYFALAQSGQTPPPKDGKVHLWSKIGSFSMEGQGQVVLNFEGTLLLSGHHGPPPQITGKVRKEFDKIGRVVWFGSGKAVIQGSWRHLNWFGKDMDCVWHGRGIVMTFGEFDEKGQTGFTQVDDLPPQAWLTGGLTFYVPKESSPYYGKTRPAPPGMKLGGGTGA
ncbi:MAG TPA: hypothetical protein VFG65_06510 [Fimbriimonadales bacterium]|jgi:hypothetical protein|nr:hypothetical protein [Fimbriimonadales bacterium]